jgi:hypothetical protein
MVSQEHSPKHPEAFRITRLIAQDFDGTIAQTFQKSPNGIGVDEATEIAVDQLFGPSNADTYKKNGGLRNRAPLEVVQELSPGVSNQEIETLLTGLIVNKLDILTAEIGTRFNDGSIWPRPVAGYVEFLENLEHARTEGQYIDSLILSSGHEAFIKKIYSAWNVQEPDYITAQETTVQHGLGHVVKPDSTLMKLAHTIWAESYGIRPSFIGFQVMKGRTVYVGDDDTKDGQLARNSGVTFALIDPADTAHSWEKISRQLKIKEDNYGNA